LKKLPDGADGTKLYDWAKFIAAESDEELNSVAERNQEVKKAVVKYRELTSDERTRDMYERVEKARRDQVSREKWARKQGMMEVAQKLLKRNRPINEIVEDTGLSYDEINELINV